MTIKAKGKINGLRNRVALCKQSDVVTQDGQMVLLRESVVWTWAEIAMQWHIPSFMSVQGFAIKEIAASPYAERHTHHISVRMGLGVLVRSTAWVYEERRKSPPRWYKVVGVGEADEWLVLTCHLVEESDDAQPPLEGPLAPHRSEVKL